jgi:hypothetical protein
MARRRKKERGFMLTAIAISITALFATLPLAIDLGRLAFTANEVQTVADVAATAGATYLMSGQDPATARTQARAVVAQNRVDGAVASIPSDANIEVGQYDPQNNTFTNGAAPYNAVRATPSATITNRFAGIFGPSYQTSTVTRSAIAGFSGPSQAAPTLPLVIGACDFQSIQSCFGTNGCLPKLTQAPNTSDDSGWIKGGNVYCGANASSAPTVSIGQTVDLTNGQVTPTLKAVQDCFPTNKGKPDFSSPLEFTIPIVDGACDQTFNQTRTVVGFATIVVSCVAADGNDACPNPSGNLVTDKGINLQAIFKQVSGPVGGGAYGTGQMRLYN